MKAYEQIRGHQPDFIVRYRLYSPEEGGRKVTYQHLRCDFMYEGDDSAKDGIYMIHPEFLSEKGGPISSEIAVPLVGKATMWILTPNMRDSVHRSRIKVGVRGRFMEGSRKIGDVEVEEVVGLHVNPVV